MKYMLLIYIDEAKGAQVAKDLGETQMTAPYIAYTEALQKAGRRALIVAGFATHMCVSATVRSALDHGYASTVVAAACATRDLPDPLGGQPVSAADLQRVALVELADRFATVVPDASALAAA